jgi:hypothetical protein
MEITCSGSAIVRTLLKTGKNFSEIFGKPIAQLSVRTPYDYRQDATQNRKEFQRNFWKADRTVVRPDAL